MALYETRGSGFLESAKMKLAADIKDAEAKIEIIGIRPGEKLHEVMISNDDSINTLEFDSYFVIQPAHPWWDNLKYKEINGGTKVENNFTYSSDNNTKWLSIEDLKRIIYMQ